MRLSGWRVRMSFDYSLDFDAISFRKQPELYRVGNGHYGGKAEVSMDVGEAMGKAMVELLKSKK